RSNLHRQVIHTVDDLGRPKVDSGAEHLLALSPDVDVRRHQVRLDPQNVTELLSGYDLVLDGTDNFTTRYLVNDACAKLGIPLIWASIFRSDAQISVFWSRPPNGEQPRTLRDLFPHQPPEGSVPSCAEGGVLGALCGQVGAIMANGAMKRSAGVGDPLFGRELAGDPVTATVDGGRRVGLPGRLGRGLGGQHGCGGRGRTGGDAATYRLPRPAAAAHGIARAVAATGGRAVRPDQPC